MNRRKTRTVAATILSLSACAVLGACCPQKAIDADAVSEPLIRVADRHDHYVDQDASLTDAEKRTYLRTTELLREIVDAAQSTQD
jgi:hypothetical protein